MYNIDFSAPIYTLTVEDLIKILDKYNDSHQAIPQTEEKTERWLKGISELADFLGTSKSTAQRIKASGILIPATIQSGRTCLFDPVKVQEALQSRSAVIRYRKHKKK